MIVRLSFASLATVCLLAVVAGCNNTADSQTAAIREAFLLVQAPEDASSIAEAKQNLEQSSDVTIEGQLDLKKFATTGNKNALVLLREVSDDSHSGDPNHDPETCPFCRRKAKLAPKAAVQFVDKNGKVVPHSVQELFQVQHGDVVVIRGRGEYDKEIDLFSIKANGIFVRPPSTGKRFADGPNGS